MKKSLALSALLMAAACTPAEKKIPSEKGLPCLKRNGEVEGRVSRVVDGDTFDVITDLCGKVRIRIWGVDCPESSNNSKCKRQKCNPNKGKRVSKKVRNLIGGEDITLEPPYKKNGNRILGYIDLDGKDFGRSLVKKCLCKSGYKHQRKKAYRRDGKKCRRGKRR